MTVPVATLKNSCYWSTVWEEIGHLSAVKNMEHVGDLEMEVMMLLKANVLGYFTPTPETKQIWKRETHSIGIWTHYKSPFGIMMRVLHTKGLP